MHDHLDEKTILAFDFGMRRIGVAIGDTISHSATPLTTLDARDGIPSWDEIAMLISKWKADMVVVGMPYNLDGSIQEITQCARKFSNRIRGRFNIPVETIDERLTSKMAKIAVSQKNKKDYSIDSVAASIILEAWLNRQHQDRT